jgi:hypothetical protein
MIDTKELRDRAATFGSDYLTDEEWVEVIDRLDVAEKELESWRGLAQQLGNEVGALRFRFERRHDELNRLRANLESAEKERDALRARIDEMEKQEPVAWARKLGLDVPSFGCVTDLKYRPSDIPESSYTPLYLAPGAQPAPSFADAYKGAMEEVSICKMRALEAEDMNRKFIAEINGPTHMGEPAQPAPSVPDDMMRDAERYRYLRARDDETAGVGCWLEAKGRACDRGWLYGVQLDSAIDSFIEMLAAAPEAKPCPTTPTNCVSMRPCSGAQPLCLRRRTKSSGCKA